MVEGGLIGHVTCRSGYFTNHNIGVYIFMQKIVQCHMYIIRSAPWLVQLTYDSMDIRIVMSFR